MGHLLYYVKDNFFVFLFFSAGPQCFEAPVPGLGCRKGFHRHPRAIRRFRLCC